MRMRAQHTLHPWQPSLRRRTGARNSVAVLCICLFHVARLTTGEILELGADLGRKDGAHLDAHVVHKHGVLFREEVPYGLTQWLRKDYPPEAFGGFR